MDYPFDLGAYARPVTTKSPEAQIWFNRGLVWTYAYHHEEAMECYRRASDADPDCVMARWGLAYAAGPNYNKQWEHFEDEEKAPCLDTARAALDAAEAALPHAQPVERALIEALGTRYPAEVPEEYDAYNDAFADAMRKVHEQFPDDLEVTAIFAEAIMNRTPWELWDINAGKPAEGADTEEAIAVLEGAFARDPAAKQHPGLLHMYIHLMEMSPHPERALWAGDRLVGLVPDAGHLVHMATHIDVLTGQYHDVVDRNHRATLADQRWLDYGSDRNFYTLYRFHNFHFKVYGALFLGQYSAAMEGARGLQTTLSEPVLAEMADWFEAFYGTDLHVMIRFGKWQEIVDKPLPDDRQLYAMTTALQRYARGVAHAALGNPAAARGEQVAFNEARAAVPESRMLFNNTCEDILGVAEKMLDGEILYREENFDAAFAALSEAVSRDDGLHYDEPWGWMQPARHALGALLSEQQRWAEAEAVYRADLGLDGSLARACQHPDNMWSLKGLLDCLNARGDTVEAPIIERRLTIAAARSEVPLKASCFCAQAAQAA